MLKIENVVLPSAEQWEAIIRGMRNPKNSWDRMDSFVCEERLGMTNEEIEATCGRCPIGVDRCDIRDDEDHFIIGPNDKQLMTSLANGGPVHAKYRRMIPVFLDITAPLYWWKEFDTYKVGTVANSCSTMHKIHAKRFELDDFSHEHLINEPLVESSPGVIEQFNLQARNLLEITIGVLNTAREMFLKTNDKKYWWQMIQLLPTSYNQKRTVMLNYEVLVNIYKWRKNHRLDEWHTMCSWIESLPYSELITGCNKEKENEDE